MAHRPAGQTVSRPAPRRPCRDQLRGLHILQQTGHHTAEATAVGGAQRLVLRERAYHQLTSSTAVLESLSRVQTSGSDRDLQLQVSPLGDSEDFPMYVAGP